MKHFQYYTNNKDTVVAVLKSRDGYFRGEAKCHKEDEFDFNKGMNIAAARAEILLNKARIEEARDYRDEIDTLIKELQSRRDGYNNKITKLKSLNEKLRKNISDIS